MAKETQRRCTGGRTWGERCEEKDKGDPEGVRLARELHADSIHGDAP